MAIFYQHFTDRFGVVEIRVSSFSSEQTVLFAAKKHVAWPVLKGTSFAIADGEKIQIGEQLDWRVTSERTGGNRSGRASRAAFPLGFGKRGRGAKVFSAQ